MNRLRRTWIRESGLAALALSAAFLALSATAASAVDEAPGSGGPLQPSASVAELRSHIPDAVAENCVEEPIEESQQEEGTLAIVQCTTSEQASVRYELFDGLDTMVDQFELSRFVITTFGHDESARTCADGWYDDIWFLGDDGVPGRLLCQKSLYGEQAAFVVWSHPATRIVSVIRQDDGDAEAAWNLWIVAGPS